MRLLQSHYFMDTNRNKIQPEIKNVRKAFLARLHEPKLHNLDSCSIKIPKMG
jgi:hypothetical protein